MASRAVEDTIDAYLAANWSTSAILTENEQGSVPDDGSAFVILQFPASNVDRVSVGRKLYQEEGAFRLVIAVPRGSGTDAIRAYGETLATLFRDQRIGTVDCLAPSEPFTDDQSDKGLYFYGSLVVPFRRFFSDT